MHLDKNQLKAVKANERNVLVVAAPGSGKTTVIINRIKYLVDEVGVYPSNIIVITFTKAAALNMKNRYINTFHKESSPFFGTFHGLFYKILLREGANINIIEGYITNKIIEGVLRKYSDEVNEDRVKEAVNNISLFKTSGENINDFKPSIAKDIFMECYDAYDKYKKENNLWDFDDLTIKVLELFKNNKRIREGYKRVFKYILVDEFQDCDDLQIEFLKLMTEGEENSLFAVGDEDQCIYSFRGSKPEYMVSFDKTFKSAKKYYLHINYRSNKNIIESSKKVISFNKERNKKDIQWYKDKDGIILCKGVYDERIQGDEISGKIRAFYNKSSYRYKENIVLYRTNMEAMSVIDSFIRNKIPFTLLDK